MHYIHTSKPSIILLTGVDDDTKINDKAPPLNDYFPLDDENLLMSAQGRLGYVISAETGSYLVITSKHMNMKRCLSDVLGAGNIMIK